MPHLGIALLCWPGGWFYTDYIPRTDIVVDGDYFDRYYAPPNEAWLEHRADPEFAWFTSRAGVHPRLPVAERVCLLLRAHGTEHPGGQRPAARPGRPVARLGRRGPAVPLDERDALRERDLATRRNIADRDPANVMGVRYFGEETTQRLVRALWGGDRELPRAVTTVRSLWSAA